MSPTLDLMRMVRATSHILNGTALIQAFQNNFRLECTAEFSSFVFTRDVENRE